MDSLIKYFKTEESSIQKSPWKILIVDDEREVHVITKMVLEKFVFENRPLEFISAFSGYEAKHILKNNLDIALVFLDVVMESDQSGLDVVRFIREELKNKDMRIILRTGQPGSAPESQVIVDYDINDYKEKTDITSQKLKTIVIAALRSYRDVVALERQKHEILNSISFLEQLINSMYSAIIVVDKHSKILLWNEATEEYTGISKQDALEKSLSYYGQFFDPFQEYIQKAQKESVRVKEYYKNFGLNKSKFVNIEFVPIDFGGEMGLLLRFDNVTELVQKDELLKRSQKLETVGSLAAGLGHDINNILNSITGATELFEQENLVETSKKDSEYDDFLHVIKRSSERAADLVKQLMTISKQSSLETESVNLNSIINTVAYICRSSFPKSIKLDVLLTEKEAFTFANRGQVEQILLNLCINANHAMTIMRGESREKGGELSIKLTLGDLDNIKQLDLPMQKYFCVQVSDTGVGMDQTTISKIFDPFFTTKSEGEGTGLGLAMVKKLVESMGGSIFVESELGVGTTFSLFFPKHTGEKKKVSIKKKAAKGTDILLCDDEELMLKVGQRILEKLDFKVMTASSGKIALDIYKQNKDQIGVVLLDHLMPDQDGLLTLKQLQTFDPDVKVVLSSGGGMNKEIEEAVKDQNVFFLPKPYTVEKLSNILKEAING